MLVRVARDVGARRRAIAGCSLERDVEAYFTRSVVSLVMDSESVIKSSAGIDSEVNLTRTVRIVRLVYHEHAACG